MQPRCLLGNRTKNCPRQGKERKALFNHGNFVEKVQYIALFHKSRELQNLNREIYNLCKRRR